MKKFFFLFLMLVFLFPQRIFSQGWQKLKSDHFVVHFTSDEKFAKEILNKAEKYYRRIALELGYPRYEKFWTWENRVNIYVYPDHQSFLKATNQPSWSYGMADYTNKQIVGFQGSEKFVDSILPHEMAHLIFRDFVGFKGEIPLWLDEGVAQWAEGKNRELMKAKAKELYNKDSLLPLKYMMRVDIRRLPRKKKVYMISTTTKTGEKGVLFLSLENLISIYYLQSFSLVGYLIEKYGPNRFTQFCRELRDGKTVEEALRAVYFEYIKSINDLEEKWREYLQNYNQKGG